MLFVTYLFHWHVKSWNGNFHLEWIFCLSYEFKFEISEVNCHWLGADHPQMLKLPGNLRYESVSLSYLHCMFIFWVISILLGQLLIATKRNCSHGICFTRNFKTTSVGKEWAVLMERGLQHSASFGDWDFGRPEISVTLDVIKVRLP